jgi:hypothetical protein
VRQVRVGSRLRRGYETPQTPFPRVVVSPSVHRDRVAELQRNSLDPFPLSRTIQAKLERLFQLSADATRPIKDSPFAPASTEMHRKKKEAKKKEKK